MHYEIRAAENDYFDDGYEQLVRVDDDGSEKVIWIDGHEPEDMYLFRDLGVFVDELNYVARRNERIAGGAGGDSG